MIKRIKSSNSLLTLSLVLLFTLSLSGQALAASQKSYESEALSKITAVEKLQTELSDLITKAEKKRVSTKVAKIALSESEYHLEDADDDILGKDYKDALDEAEEAFDLLEDAIDSLEDGLSEEAEKKLDEAEEVVDIAEDLFDYTDKKAYHYGNAGEILNQAKVKLTSSKSALKNKEYDNSVTLSEEASDLAKDMFAELGINYDNHVKKLNEAKEAAEVEDDDIEEVEIDTDDEELKSEMESEEMKSLQAKVEQLQTLIKLLIQLKELMSAQQAR